ncbi:SDR family NAD(P)-dependent oxidoreductase [Aspergillus novofumigatus IBT 16806]|uniref:NAD(P)-binding protein n=1 Tax=Aspergillus novofumigatus (strain IBT 16806) TaxID=1392255 RepID=A0A2I1BUT5_ASPN1|nr:NAD(P)-binding protein [Aspergillus novofumigatus IBT 16806]PKX89148.1 NAD(P)-binding protein [Aspergillus novofumigatus IBT 16806]
MDISTTIDPNDLFSAKGLVVVITGGGSGIGLAITSCLSQAGAAHIYILGRHLSTLQEAATSVGAAVVPIQCDITSHASVSAAVAKIEAEIGYIDVLINNAGVQGPDHRPARDAETIEELQRILLTDPEGWQPTFAANSSAVVGVSAAFLKLLDAGNRRRGWEGGKIPLGRPRRRDITVFTEEGTALHDERSSQIITVGSISGLNRFITAGLAYGASKAAAIHLSKMLTYLLAPWGIRCNVINPGVYPSRMTAGTNDNYSYMEVPAGRKGMYQDICGVVLYLVGKAGAYVNGSMENTDGGRLSVMPATY